MRPVLRFFMGLGRAVFTFALTMNPASKVTSSTIAQNVSTATVTIDDTGGFTPTYSWTSLGVYEGVGTAAVTGGETTDTATLRVTAGERGAFTKARFRCDVTINGVTKSATHLKSHFWEEF